MWWVRGPEKSQYKGWSNQERVSHFSLQKACLHSFTVWMNGFHYLPRENLLPCSCSQDGAQPLSFPQRHILGLLSKTMYFTLKMEVAMSSTMLVFYCNTIWSHNPENHNLNVHCCESSNLALSRSPYNFKLI